MKTYRIEVTTIVYIEADNEDEALENTCAEIQHGLNEYAVDDYESIECKILE